MKRSVFLLGLTLLALCIATSPLFAGGASESTGGVKTVTFWNGFTGPDRPTIEAMVKQFNDTHPNIKVDMQISPWDSLYQKLLPAFIAGTAPDVIGFDTTMVPQYALAGKIAPLDSYLASSKALSRDVLVPSLLSASTVNGKLYGVPMNFSSMVMYYNKTEFAKAGLDPNNPPKTLSDLEKAWKKLVVRNSSGDIAQYAQAFGIRATVPMIPVIFWDFGAQIVGPDSTSGLDTPQALQAAEFLKTAFVVDHASPIGLTGQDADNLFAAGKAAIEWNGPWALTGFQQAGIDVGVAELPSGPAGQHTWGGGDVLVMNASSKVKNAVWSFMEYWNTPSTQLIYTLKQASPPTRTDMANDPQLAQNPYLKYFVNSAKFAQIYLAGQPKAAQIDQTVMTPMYESIGLGKLEPQAALAKANTDLAAILAQK